MTKLPDEVTSRPPGADRSRDTRRALIDAAIADMEATGEASIRITKILSETGISNGSLYHHFGSREGLVQAAIAERFLGAVTAGLGAFADRIREIRTPEQLQELFRFELERYGSPEVRDQRLRRLTALAAALPRAELRQRIIADQARYFDAAGDALSRLQDRGLIRADIDIRAFSAWFLGLTLSRVLSELDPDLDPDREWSEFTLTALLAILIPPTD
ncbi:MAG: TetR/AcrR family transcriptional regulator [Acidobacteria bacterium]|nr:TetR/AcrR family transcriptional regulator [Acidobacteriota bacterium]